MRFIHFSLIIILILLSSCTNNQEIKIPNNILSEDKMIEVLTYCYLSEGASGINVKNVETPKFDSAYAFNPLKDKGIDKAKFDSSLIFYAKNPIQLKLIYDKVLEKLSEIQAKGKVD